MSMYNEEQKMRFLDNCSYEMSTVEVVKLTFNKTELVERQHNKDLSEFIRPDVVDLLKSFNSKSKRRLQVLCKYFSDYYNWCKSEGLVTDPVNQYDRLMTESIINDVIPSEALNNKYFTEEDLIGYMDNVPDVTNKFIMYGIFNGIRGDNYDNLVNAKIEDYDPVTKTLKLKSGLVIKVNSLLYNLMWQADDDTHYYADGIEKESRFRKFEYLRTGYIIKPTINGGDNSPVLRGIIHGRLATIKKQVGNEFISGSTLYKNGLVSYVKKRFEERGIDLKSAITEKINGLSYRYEKDTQTYIEEFGSKMTPRMLRSDIDEYLDLL
jgi:hypothetical protein